jgi:hypothetical protein
MNTSDIKNIMISSLKEDADAVEVSERLREAGVTYDFSSDFTDKVIGRLASAGLKINRELEFFRYMNLTFYRVAFTGVAAIVILLISIFFMEGSLSFNSFLGLSDNYDESIVSLLTGN